MKKLKWFTLLTLAMALLLTQLAYAEPSEAVKGIFDALTAEGTDYSQTKALYAEYYPETVYEETLEGDGFTIAVTGNEYMDGSWTFTRDGDYLTASISGDDFSGMMLVMEVVSAVGDYYGIDSTLMSGYVNGLSALDQESDNFSMVTDEAAGTYDVRIYIAAPWDMKELDQMVLDETVISPMEEGYSSTAAHLGKLMMVANDNGDSVTILLGEYDHLDDLALRSMVNAVSILKPEGWESFVANYTELSDSTFDNYTVTLNATEDMVSEIIDDANDNYEYAIIRFGLGDD